MHPLAGQGANAGRLLTLLDTSVIFTYKTSFTDNPQPSYVHGSSLPDLRTHEKRLRLFTPPALTTILNLKTPLVFSRWYKTNCFGSSVDKPQQNWYRRANACQPASL